MASPIAFHIIADGRLNFLFDKKEYKNHPTSKDLTYELDEKTTEAISRFSGNTGDGEDCWEGHMSSISDLSLPSKEKEKAGIKKDAEKYAFMYPPKGLAKVFDWGKVSRPQSQEEMNRIVQQRPPSRKMDTAKNILCCGLLEGNSAVSPDQTADPDVIEWTLACFSVLGAFVYFDNKLDVVCVNVLSLSERGANSKINLTGPFKTPPEKAKQLKQLNWFGLIPLVQYHEGGYVAKAWVQPLKGEQRHGYFAFLKEDGSITSYEVRSWISIEPEGCVGLLSDLINLNKFDLPTLMAEQDFVTTNDCVSCLYKSKFLQKQQKKLNSTLKHGRNAFHELCRITDDGSISDLTSGEELEELEELFKSSSTNHLQLTKKLRTKDQFGWTPLHYACRFRANDLKLIDALLQKCPKAFFDKDRFDRFPLHLALEGSFSPEVIKSLLKHDKENKITFATTKHLKRIPLHIACYNDAPVEVIQDLLNKDAKKASILAETSTGRQAIHIAIDKRARHDVIALLLKADVGKSYRHKEFQGMLPLHMACWNCHIDAVKLLLTEDEENNKAAIHAPMTKLKFDNVLDDEADLLILKRDDRNELNGVGPISKESGITALHLALLTNSTEIAKLLLYEEEKFSTAKNPQTDSIMIRDSNDRIPLHIACMNGTDEEIIRLLLSLDRMKKTTITRDEFNCTPLHYASEKKFASEKIIKMLLENEDDYWANLDNNESDHLNNDSTDEQVTKSTSVLNKQYMTPLLLAVQANAPITTLEMFLHEDRIDLQRFDEHAVQTLSKRVKDSDVLRRLINHKFAMRLPFLILMVKLQSKIVSFTAIIISAEALLSTEFHLFSTWVIPCLIFELCLTSITEIQELLTNGMIKYLGRAINYVDTTTIILLFISLQILITNQLTNQGSAITVTQNEVRCLILTGVTLGLGIVLALRMTFLPFAQFTGGLFIISLKLVPFFIISIIFLLCFTYGFRMSDSFNDAAKDAKTSCTVSFQACLFQVLDAFFAGGGDTDGLLDVLFGFIVIIVLLTIVIAIVGDAWKAAESKASQFYWESRISFLSDIFLYSSFRKDSIPSWLTDRGEKLTSWIDNRKGVVLNSQKTFSWTQETPYSEVTTKDQYDNPSEYFIPEKAKIIAATQSLESDFYWASMDDQKGGKLIIFTTALKWFGFASVYFFLIILGLVSGGFFWPRALRIYFAFYGSSDDQDSKIVMNNEDDEAINGININAATHSEGDVQNSNSQLQDRMIEQEMDTETELNVIFDRIFMNVVDNATKKDAEKLDFRSKLSKIDEATQTNMRKSMKQGGFFNYL